jgi:ligand-binding SRPBCC domain-containing protein
MKIIFTTNIPLNFSSIRDGFNEELFIKLAPPLIPFKLLRFDGCKKGDEVHIQLGVLPFKQTWVSDITFEEENDGGWSFIDEGRKLPWPLSYWKHHHRVDKLSESESLIVDDINFETSPKALAPMIYPFLWLIFSIRPARYKKFFQAPLQK